MSLFTSLDFWLGLFVGSLAVSVPWVIVPYLARRGARS